MSQQHQDTCTALGICVVANIPVILWGDPGAGKTSVINQLANDYDMHLETVIASLREPSDFAGLPVVDPVTKSVALAPPGWSQRLVDHGEGIVFYDEISTAPPAVQAALLRPILEGVVGDLALPAKVRSIAAANPADIAAGGWDLAPPVANRFVHLNWRLIAEDVRDGFSSGWEPISLPMPDADRVASLFTEAKILVGSFLGSRPELVSRMPDSSEQSGMAFPTPRTWEMAAKLYAFGQAAGVNSNVIQLLLAGTVGVAATGEFISYVANLDLPDPETLLKDPDAFVVPSERGDKVYAIAASVWAATAGNNTKERWEACGRVLAAIANAEHADIAYTYGKKWSVERPKDAYPTGDTVKALAPILTELGKFMK